MNDRSVLIVSASAGTGHLRAGDALLHAARQYRPNWSVEHVDVLTLAPRWVKAAYGAGFELVATHAPRIWRGAYSLADGPDVDQARWAGIARRMLFRAFERLLGRRTWDHVICTHFLPAQLAAGRVGRPCFSVVVTDFDLHRFWVQPRVQHYFVATAALEQQLHGRLDNVQISRTGIPIDPAFNFRLNGALAKRRLGLDPQRPVFLVMGGGVGIGVASAALSLAKALPPHVQIAALCGTNTTALGQLYDADIPLSRLRCFGYRRDMPVVYAAADLIVTKPGGLTCSEALALGKPLLLTRPIPGHEEANVKVLTDAGAAVATSNARELGDAALSLLNSPAQIEIMRTAAETLGRPRAARAIIDQVAMHMLTHVAA